MTQAEKLAYEAQQKEEVKRKVNSAVVESLSLDARQTIDAFVALPPPSCTSTILERLTMRECVPLEEVAKVMQNYHPKVTTTAVAGVLTSEGLPVENERKAAAARSWFSAKMRGGYRGGFRR
jgi:hypothetical protein